jgi:hypothetical protein
MDGLPATLYVGVLQQHATTVYGTAVHGTTVYGTTVYGTAVHGTAGYSSTVHVTTVSVGLQESFISQMLNPWSEPISRSAGRKIKGCACVAYGAQCMRQNS